MDDHSEQQAVNTGDLPPEMLDDSYVLSSEEINRFRKYSPAEIMTLPPNIRQQIVRAIISDIKADMQRHKSVREQIHEQKRLRKSKGTKGMSGTTAPQGGLSRRDFKRRVKR